MSNYDSGVARAAYILDISQPHQAATELRALFAGIQTGAGGAGAGAAIRAPALATQTSSITQLQRAQAGLELQQARLARTQGDVARAAELESQAQQRLISTLSQQNTTTTQTIGIQRQLVSSQQQIERASQQSAGFAQQFGQGIKSGLLGIVGPAALATAALGTVVKVGESFKEAFEFKSQLDQTNASISNLLHGVRDTSQVFDQAQKFAARYKLTQQETSEAISESIPVIRNSKASIEDILSVFTRLTILKPGKTFADASRAIAELQAGQAVSLEKIFNVPIDKANALKHEIEGGADAINVLNKFLTDSGVGMNALEIRTRGAIGAMNDLKVAEEQRKLAQAKLAEGPGLGFIGAQTVATRDLTVALGGGGGFGAVLQNNAALIKGNVAGLTAFQIALLKTKSLEEAFAIAAAVRGQAIADSVAAVDRSTDATRQSGAAFEEDRIAIGKAQIANEAARDVEDRRVRTLTLLSASARDAAQAMRDETGVTDAAAQKSVLDAAAKETQQAKTALLSAQNKQTVDSFLALNPQISQSGVIALVAAGQLSSEIGQLALLRLRAADATSQLDLLNLAQSNLANQKATDKAVATGRFFGRESGRGGGSDVQADALAFVGVLKTQNQEQQGLLDSEIALASAKKDTAREIELLRQKQSDYAKGTKEYNTIEAQIIGIQLSSGRKRIDAAASTALQLNNVEENSQLQLARTQREGLERLRDQQQDFDLHRTRNQEDEDRKIQSLLAHGQRAQAVKEREDFARQQRRDREDFDIQRRRTLRNNEESIGDIEGRADLRQSQIGERAALRGVKPAGGALPAGTAPLPPGATAAPAAPRGAPQTVARLEVSGVVNLDGKQVGMAVWPTIEVLVDDELSVSLQAIGVPGSGQPAVAGAG